MKCLCVSGVFVVCGIVLQMDPLSKAGV